MVLRFTKSVIHPKVIFSHLDPPQSLVDESAKPQLLSPQDTLPAHKSIPNLYENEVHTQGSSDCCTMTAEWTASVTICTDTIAFWLGGLSNGEGNNAEGTWYYMGSKTFTATAGQPGQIQPVPLNLSDD